MNESCFAQCTYTTYRSICFLFILFIRPWLFGASHLGNGADGAQRLPSEAVRLQALQVLVATDLRGEVHHGHHGSVGGFDSKAVIAHFYPVQTVVLLQTNAIILSTACATGGEIQISIFLKYLKAHAKSEMFQSPEMQIIDVLLHQQLYRDTSSH